MSKQESIKTTIKKGTKKHLISKFPPIWKIALLILLMSLLGVAGFYVYKGFLIEVLTILAILFVFVGIFLVLALTISKELFLWLIGKRSEYEKVINASQVVAIGLSKLAIDVAPVGLKKEEKERLKKDVPILVQMRFMASMNNYIIRILIGAFATAFGLLGTIVLMNQNKKIEQQTELLEADRRSSLVFLMGDIISSIDKELKDDYLKDKIRNLSPELIGRIVSLSHSFKPYKYFTKYGLTRQYLSPERGQLLIFLLNTELDESTYEAIFDKASFAYSDLPAYKFNEQKLVGIDLKKSNLVKASFYKCELENVDFSEADLSLTNFDYAFIDRVDFGFSILKSVSFRMASIHSADFRGSKIEYLVDEKTAQKYIKKLNPTHTSYDTYLNPDKYRTKDETKKSVLDYFENKQLQPYVELHDIDFWRLLQKKPVKNDELIVVSLF